MHTPRAEPRHALLLALLVDLRDGGPACDRQQERRPDPCARDRRLGVARARGLAPARRARPARDRRPEDAVARAARRRCRRRRRHAAGAQPGRANAVSSQKLLVSRLALSGVSIHPDFSFARVLNGFSASLDPSAIPLVERDQDVVGVYPVRIAYPSTISTDVLSRPDFGPGSGHRPDIGVSGVDGRGVTIALLDTGVDPAVPYLRGRILEGIDVIGGNSGALAAAQPGDPSQLERHGTQMAGLLVGGGGPAGLSGVATGAAVLPIRVAGWQPDAFGHWAIYARSDQIIAGLDRAVDPNDDGDAHDAARVALVALAEPFAGFTDGPEARAAAGALALDTLVVVPSGNDGASAAGYGDIAGPGGAAAALTVGALDTRTSADEARVVVRSGLDTDARHDDPALGRRHAGQPARPRRRGAARHARRHEGHRAAARRLLQPQGREHRRRTCCARAGRCLARAGRGAGRAGRSLRGSALRRTGRAPRRRSRAPGVGAGSRRLAAARRRARLARRDSRQARPRRSRSDRRGACRSPIEAAWRASPRPVLRSTAA